IELPLPFHTHSRDFSRPAQPYQPKFPSRLFQRSRCFCFGYMNLHNIPISRPEFLIPLPAGTIRGPFSLLSPEIGKLCPAAIPIFAGKRQKRRCFPQLQKYRLFCLCKESRKNNANNAEPRSKALQLRCCTLHNEACSALQEPGSLSLFFGFLFLPLFQCH